MKKIGLVGGLGPASTVEYYLGIIEKSRVEQGEDVYPEIVIDSVNMSLHDKALTEKDYNKLCDYLLCSLSDLKAAGAEIAAITANIPDNPDLYDYMTGIKYLNFIADVFGVSAEDRQARIRKYADLFELTADLAQPIAAYSHGMKQKLAIIAAWLHQPKLIIMDEPFVGLDPKASHLLKGMMREVCDAGGAIFFSTHVLEVAEKLCDKVAIIKGGKLIRSGTMEEVKGDDSLEEVFLELEGEIC